MKTIVICKYFYEIYVDCYRIMIIKILTLYSYQKFETLGL